MSRVLVFGNSGSGKSTLASQLSRQGRLGHLDLDTIAWLPTSPPERAPLAESHRQIDQFMESHQGWVIEGCYTDLLELAAVTADEIIYMNLPIAQCLENARRRPWEPHKYESREAQDANLAMLEAWIDDYERRDGVFSAAAHRDLYDRFEGRKTMHTQLPDLDA